MQCNSLPQQVWWFDGRVMASILEIKGSNFTNGVFVINSGKLIKYFPLWFPKLSAYLG
jgi:hypothetical protein